MPASFVVLEDPSDDGADVVERLRGSGLSVRRGFDRGERGVVCTGIVATVDEAQRALLAAVSGAALVVLARAPRDVVDRMCDDLRRVGTVQHFPGPRARAPALDAEAKALLTILAGGVTLGEAAELLHVSRRTADRRLAAARRALGERSTTAAILAARRHGLI